MSRADRIIGRGDRYCPGPPGWIDDIDAFLSSNREFATKVQLPTHKIKGLAESFATERQMARRRRTVYQLYERLETYIGYGMLSFSLKIAT